MFSTSSSEWNCTEPFYFDTFPNIAGNTFCLAAKQPLIYYAKIEEPFNPPQAIDNRKKHSNYFMKAFRWYTQEHESSHKNKDTSSLASNNGFATWLDKKYNEYIEGSHRAESNHILKQSSTFESDGILKKKKSTKKFGRIHSPWRRRRRNIKETPFNNHDNFQYILQPKDLSRAASDCCHRTSRIQSTTSIISKGSPKCVQDKVKSKSLLSIYRAKCRDEAKEMPTLLKTKNVECECHKSDAGTQYETYSLESSRPYNYKHSSVLCECTPFTDRANLNTVINEKKDGLQAQDILVNQLPSIPKTSVMFTDTNMTKSGPLNLSAQTSDHSINLGDVFFKKPIYLKVVHVKV